MTIRWDALFARGRHGEMERLARVATGDDPEDGTGWKMLGLAIMLQGRFGEALPALRHALARLPGESEIHAYLGITLRALGRMEEAEGCYRAALECQPDYAEAHNNLGNLLRETGRLDEAEVSYHLALKHKPDYADACYNLGGLLTLKGRFVEAERACRHLLALRPDCVEALNNLAVLLQNRGGFDEAEACYRRALELDPGGADMWCNLGKLLHRRHRFVAAGEMYRQTIALQPEHADAWYNYGVLLQGLKRFAEAETAYREVLRLGPGREDARWNLGVLYLSSGRFGEGWPLHEARDTPNNRTWREMLSVNGFVPWQGEALAGKSLLIIPEQGYGDQIQFCRYVPLLKSLGVLELSVVCAAPLAPVLTTLAGVDRLLVAEEVEEIPWHDYWVFSLSIPWRLGTTLETIPAEIPYLHPLPERVAHWAWIVHRPGLRVGLVWKGSAEHKNDAHRSLAGLEILSPLWSVPGISFFGLQKAEGEVFPDSPVMQLGEGLRDFADTAAVMSHLDLVISIDSAVAHLAGALGKPCWVLVPHWETDWRWLQERNDSPWYPDRMRLFRQTRLEEWDPVVRQVAEALARQCVVP
ncbi:MAG: glycosyltransferase family protein [Magnetococcales bacterium]|nr:glycosyltransferase family protein [Magnetococcales bacterium]